MAKKRRLSKRDRAIKSRINYLEIWIRIMRDVEFKEELGKLIQSIDKSISGELHIQKEVLLYIVHEGEFISNVYFVAFLKGEKAVVAAEPLPAFESSF